MLHNLIAITAILSILITSNYAQVTGLGCGDYTDLTVTGGCAAIVFGTLGDTVTPPQSNVGPPTQPCECCLLPANEDCIIRVTPAPITPAPVTPAPVTPAPVTPAPITPAPVTPAPVTPAPVTTTTTTITTCVCPDDGSSESFSATSFSSDSSDVTGATEFSSDSSVTGLSSDSDSSDGSSSKVGCICTTTPAPVTVYSESSESGSSSSGSSDSGDAVAAHVADNVRDDFLGDNELNTDDEHYTMHIHFSDATLMNIWGLFGVLMIANMLCCYLCQKKRNQTQKAHLEEDQDGGARLDVLA